MIDDDIAFDEKCGQPVGMFLFGVLVGAGGVLGYAWSVIYNIVRRQ